MLTIKKVLELESEMFDRKLWIGFLEGWGERIIGLMEEKNQ